MTQEQEDITDELFLLNTYKWELEHGIGNPESILPNWIRKPQYNDIKKLVIKTKVTVLRRDLKQWREWAKRVGYYGD